MKKYRFYSHNVTGNLHSAAEFLTAHHPGWDVVAMDYVPGGDFTVIVHRVEIPAEPAQDLSRLQTAVNAAYHRLQSAPQLMETHPAFKKANEAIRDAYTELQPFVR